MAQSIWYSDQFNATGLTDSSGNPIVEDSSPSQAIRGVLVPFRAVMSTTVPVTGSKWRFIKVPKGARMHSLNWTSVKTGTVTDAPGTLGWETTAVSAFDSDVVFETDATTSSTPTDLVVDVVTSAEDYLSIVFGTIDGTGSVAATVWGAWFIP